MKHQDALARLVVQASDHGQVILASHSEPLIRAIRSEGDATEIHLKKSFGEIGAPGVDAPRWRWPKR
ncbi:hypothetical protein GTK09_23155 [Jiella sp. 40Bstr34]|uniref:Uncharacterized protein n=1 Tax=Jiella pacifica TaxID=2696469 RepID=A0A6N9T7S4_9HYPH|nr:hypothetical protein [Jiella pacifica]